MTEQYPHEGRDPIPLQPPKRHCKNAGIHWVEQVDYDGRGCGLEVWQWQPGIQKWCRPNDYARNNDRDLIHYRWIAVCPTPAFKEEVEEVRAILRSHMRQYRAGSENDHVTLTGKEFLTLYTHFFDHLAARE